VNLLALDPGIRGCGVALFRDRTLGWCAYVRSGSKAPDLLGVLDMAQAVVGWVEPQEVHQLAVEWPQVYAGSKQKGDPNDLIALAGVVAAVCTRFPGAVVTRYKPRDWKGQVPKEVIQARILGDVRPGRLSIEEVSAFRDAACPPSLQHNVLDAIGIGLHFFGRL